MLTVKIINQKTRRETIIEARSLDYDTNSGLLVNLTQENQSIHFPIETKEENFADVYVMNNNGQTVARYSL